MPLFNRFSQQDVRTRHNLNLNLDIPGLGRITCEHPLRIIQNKRIVCLGRWGADPVLVKLYFNAQKAKRNWQRSLSGARAFLERGLPAPAILYSGPLPEGKAFIIVFEYLAGADRLDKVLTRTHSEQARKDVKNQLVACLAGHHQQGVVQNDQHLGNFLVEGKMVYSLDGDQIQTFSSSVPIRCSLNNLAAFFACFPPEEDREIDSFLKQYFRLRELPLKEGTVRKVLKKTRHSRKQRIKEYMRKIFRNRDPFVVEKSRIRFCVYDQRLWDKAYAPFKGNPDNFFTHRKDKDRQQIQVNTKQGMVSVTLRKEPSWPVYWRKNVLAQNWKQGLLNHRLGRTGPRPIMFLRVKTGFFCFASYLLSTRTDQDDSSACK